MRKKYDVIVTGSGIGGSAAAALLAYHGQRVLILEKNPRIGGACSYYQKGGFHVDIGTHMFSRGNSGPIGTIQHRLGIPNKIKFIRLSNMALFKGMGINIVFPAEMYRMPAFFIRLLRQLKIPLRELPGVVRLLYDMVTMPDEEIDQWNDR